MTQAILCSESVTEALAATRRYAERNAGTSCDVIGGARCFFLGYLLADHPDVLAALNELSQAETQRDYARLVATERPHRLEDCGVLCPEHGDPRDTSIIPAAVR